MDKLKALPNDKDIEKAVLGCIINFPDEIFTVSDIVQPSTFIDGNNRSIYEVMLSMMQSNKRIGLMSLVHELKVLNKIGDVLNEIYLSELTNLAYSPSYITEHCHIIKESEIRRDLILVSNQIEKKSFDTNEPIDDIIEFTQKAVFECTVEEIKSEPEHIADITTRVNEEIEERQKAPDKIGIPSGFRELRWHDSDLIIGAARPAMGKTFVGAVKFAYEAAMTNVPVLIFSLEMSKSQMVERFISLHEGVNSNDLRNGKNIDWNKLESAQTYFNKLPIFIDDNAGLTVYQIQNKARKMKIKHNIGLIIIDYIGLISEGGNSKSTRDQDIGVITRTLKKIAKDLNVPVIALSQLNRGVEQRPDKRPKLSDLRESGNIEQDADEVIMFYRPYYYTQQDEDAGWGEMIQRKNRHGGLETVKFYHKYDWSKIEDREIIQDLSEFKIDNDFDVKPNISFEDEPFHN